MLKALLLLAFARRVCPDLLALLLLVLLGTLLLGLLVAIGLLLVTIGGFKGGLWLFLIVAAVWAGYRS